MSYLATSFHPEPGPWRTCSKGVEPGQAKRGRWRKTLSSLGLVFLVAELGLVGCHNPQANPRRQTPSGQPVPRYLSLQDDVVNARAGPTLEHRILWAYQAKGLPVQVIAETKDWRRICDPDGHKSWVKKTGVEGRRRVIRQAQGPLAIRSAAADNAPIRAYLSHRAMADLERQERGWIRIRVDGLEGWVKEREVWGTAQASQCR